MLCTTVSHVSASLSFVIRSVLLFVLLTVADSSYPSKLLWVKVFFWLRAWIGALVLHSLFEKSETRTDNANRTFYGNAFEISVNIESSTD